MRNGEERERSSSKYHGSTHRCGKFLSDRSFTVGSEQILKSVYEVGGAGKSGMDPILPKLFELWELDDFTLDDPSLCGNSSIGRHSLGSYTDGLDSQSLESLGSRMLCCEQCRHPNLECANWCVECGTAMVSTRKMSASSQLQSDNTAGASVSMPVSREAWPQLIVDHDATSKFESEHLNSPDRPTQMERTCISDDHCLLKNDLLSMYDSRVCHGGVHLTNKQVDAVPRSPKSSNAFSTTQQNSTRKRKNCDDLNKTSVSSLSATGKVYCRHWKSSNVYMWRKPSSIQKRECLPTDVCCGQQTLTDDGVSREIDMPLLDLSVIQSNLNLTSEGISTRSLSSVYQV